MTFQKIAYVQRRSVSELLSAMMEEYRGSHAAELAEYEEIQEIKRTERSFFPGSARCSFTKKVLRQS